jgi:hypothetical protein
MARRPEEVPLRTPRNGDGAWLPRPGFDPAPLPVMRRDPDPSSLIVCLALLLLALLLAP